MSSLRASLLIIAALLLCSRPAWGYRRRLSKSGGLIVHETHRGLLQEGSDNPCGQFAPDDPFDGILNGQQTPKFHQPCRDNQGIVLFCCLSGSTQCACPLEPPTAAGPFGCFDYVLGSTKNYNTGQECGYSLPGATPSPTPTTPLPTTPSPTTPLPTTPSPTTPLPTTPSPTTPSPTTPTPSPTTIPPSGGPCPNVPPRGSPNSDGTCGFDPAGQAYNLCTSAAGIQFCCPSAYVCPTADPAAASNPAYCQPLDPASCALTPTPTPSPSTPQPASPSPTNPSPTTPAPTTPSPTTPSPTTPSPTTPSPTTIPPSGGPCPNVPPRGSPNSDGTCGYDPAGQAYNLCITTAGIQFCCPTAYVCPTADPAAASNPAFAYQVYCQPLGPASCGLTPTPTPSPSTPQPTPPPPTTSPPSPSPTATPPATGCQTVSSSGSPGADGTCGYDPTGQAYNLCSTPGGIQFCCPQGYVCPTPGSTGSSSSGGTLQVFCQAVGPCGY